MKIGAIGIRTKIIVGDAATWYLVKKYLDNAVIKGAITPEEREKLSGIEENANNYTHPDGHPASILDVVDVAGGSANKFLNERGEMVSVTTSSIGVTGSPLYASTANSDVAGYKALAETPQPLETEVILTAKSTDVVVWGAKYLSAPFTEAVTIPTSAYGFDYWRKVSAANGTSRKHLRVFLYREGVETNIITSLASPDIEETEFTERQISYIFPELVLLTGDRIGIQEGFSTTHANNINMTYIVGDGRGWFMRLPLPLKHENLTDKNSEASVQHVDTTVTKNTLAENDKVPLYDSETGRVVLTPKDNLGVSSDNLIASYTHSGNKEVQPTAVDLATGTFTAVGHGLVNGDVIFPILNLGYLEATFGIIRPFPTGLLLQRYFVVEKTNDTFKVSATSGGTAVTFTSNTYMDLTKWHFEKKVVAILIISNITERDTRIVFSGWVLSPFLTISPSVDGSGGFGSINTFIGSGTTVTNNGMSILTYEGYAHVVRDTRIGKNISSLFSGVIIKPGSVSANTIAALDAKVVSLYYGDVATTNVVIGYNSSSNLIVNGTEIKIYKL